MTDCFLDTSYAIALASPPDQYHARAVSLARQITSEKWRLVTTRAVVLEIGNAMAKPRYRAAAVRLLEALEHDPGIEIIELSRTLWDRTFQLFRGRPDKGWGLTDCFSFVVMQDRGIHRAVTADDHFRQAGFRALLLET